MNLTKEHDPEITGTPNHLYDLVLVLQQALEDCVRYAGCAEDARRSGDGELADWFDQLSSSDRDIAGKAKQLLAARLS